MRLAGAPAWHRVLHLFEIILILELVADEIDIMGGMLTGKPDAAWENRSKTRSADR
jgi:hypothetical protein